MRRREYLCVTGLAGLTAVAGCTGSGDVDDASEATTTTTTTASPDEAADATPTPTESNTETATEPPASEADIVIDEHELVVDEGDFITDVYVAATITNEGDAASGMVELTADWYDADGNYLDNDKGFLESLGPGESWAARVYHLGSDSEAVADYEFAGTFETEPPQTTADGLEVGETEMNVGDDEAVIRGEVLNNRDEDASYIEATAKVYDGAGIVLGTTYTNVTDVPAGETWTFEQTWRGRERTDEAADHEVWIADSAL